MNEDHRYAQEMCSQRNDVNTVVRTPEEDERCPKCKKNVETNAVICEKCLIIRHNWAIPEEEKD